MDVSELRKRILRALEDARQDAADRRAVVDQASQAYALFLERVAVPLLKQSASVLNASGSAFVVHAPAGGARLVSERSPETYLEFELDGASNPPCVVGRISVARGGRKGQILDEHPLMPEKPIEKITEDDVSAFLVAQIPRLVIKP